jgi:hypothetical protein
LTASGAIPEAEQQRRARGEGIRSQAGRGSSNTLELLTEPHAIARWAPIPFELLDLDGERLDAGARTRGQRRGARESTETIMCRS